MAKKSTGSIGCLILQIALGLLLAIGGIWALKGAGDPAAVWLGEQSDVLRIIFGIIEIVAGIFLILALFIGDKLGSLGKILNWIVIIIFAVVIVIADLLNGSWSHDFLGTLYNLAGHLVFLGAMLALTV